MITLDQDGEGGSIDMTANTHTPGLSGEKDASANHSDVGQPENVFTVATYLNFIERFQKIAAQYDQLYQMSLKRPTPEERTHGPEKAPLDALLYQLELLRREYCLRLPIHLLARCPYCGSAIKQPVDTFSLLGCYPFFNADELYLNRSEFNNQPPRRRCKHAIFAEFAVNLNGLPADRISKSGIHGKTITLDSAPRLIVWPLVARKTSVVIHALPISRLGDPEPAQRYVAYFTTYFADDDTNVYAKEMFVPTDVGRPATEGVMLDTDLVKWLKAGRLFWLDSAAPEQPLLGRDNTDKFPYADIQPKGWYEILENGQINGPHPYYHNLVWQGSPPTHDESFAHTIE
jgi:hypothetical protein